MVKYKLVAAILGDLAGQPYEFPATGGPKDMKNFNLHNPNSHITDDTIMTLASALAVIRDSSIEEEYKFMGALYEGDYYGKNFRQWLSSPLGTIGDSWGNGCLMRAAPFMYTEDPLPRLMESVMCSHRNTIAIESVIHLYKAYKHKLYTYNDNKVKFFEKFEVRADKTAEFCINLYYIQEELLTTTGLIEEAIECGGDTDTNASIIGELSNYHNNDITEEDVAYVESKLDAYQLSILREFNEKFKD